MSNITFLNDANSWRYDNHQITKINQNECEEGDDKKIIFMLLSGQKEKNIASKLLPVHIPRLHQYARERSTKINNAVTLINEFCALKETLLTSNQNFQNFKESLLMTKLFASSLSNLDRQEVNETLKKIGQDAPEPLKGKLQKLAERINCPRVKPCSASVCSPTPHSEKYKDESENEWQKRIAEFEKSEKEKYEKKLEENAEAKRIKKEIKQKLYNESAMHLDGYLKDAVKANGEWNQMGDYTTYREKKEALHRALSEISIFCTKKELLNHQKLTRLAALRIEKTAANSY